MFMTVVTIVTLSSCAAVATFRSTFTSAADTSRWPGAHVCVMRTPRKPARTSKSICVFATTGEVERTASSVAPSRSPGPPLSGAGGADRNAAVARAATRRVVSNMASATVAGTVENGVQEQLKGLPAKPGVYLFRDDRGEVLYVGKAKSLRSRVRSYFQKTTDGRAQIQFLPERVADLEVIVTGSEVEALHLEQNLVKRHRPPFNVRLRDDKSFPYIAVTVEDEYPRVMFTRERHRRGVVYFGPYANAKKVRETLDVLNRVFPYRPCEGPRPGRHSGIPCLDFHIDRYSFHLENVAGQDRASLLEAFCLEYYGSSPSVPPQIVVPRDAGDTSALEEFLSERRGSRVEVRAAERGEKRRLQELAEQNARLALESEAVQAERTRLRRVEALEELREALNLESLPIRIECFDVSTILGESPVGSMVVFQDAVPKKAHYRKFGVRSLDGQDDFAAMAEVVSRRFARLSDDGTGDDWDESFAATPNLVVVDGGKGQLSAALAAMQAFDLPRVAVIALAKRVEEVFLPGRSEPVVLDPHSPGLQLLQRIRDEAHRFAIGFHRQRRDTRSFGSIFDDLERVGPARRRPILPHFGSSERFLAATQVELEGVPGVPARTARSIYAQLHKAGRG